ncbi:MAG: hypothetical protein P0S96_01560 [Simkaniaceae bacterium]|nr:hypothetical protein [Candidatus Sacchlamyda saccharinae]
MYKIGFAIVLAFSSAFAQDFAFDDYRVDVVEAPSTLKYVSVDLAAIANLKGVINVGVRQEGDKHGFDFGMSNGRAKEFSQSFLYGSYLKFIDASATAKYYTGFGGRSGISWGTANYAIETMGSFSVGRSFLAGSSGRQFFEVGLLWPRFYHFHFPVYYGTKGKYKNNFSNYRNVDVSLFYGWMF